MSTTYNIVVKKDSRKPKEGYLTLRKIRNRKPYDTSLKIKIQVKNFNREKQYVYSKEPNANEINEKIQEVLLQARGGKTKNFLTNKESFISYAEKIIEVIITPNTKKGKTDALNKIREYLNTIDKQDITFSEIDIFIVRGYYSYLIEKLAISSANEYITIFKYFINQVIENQVHHYTVHPFQGLQKKKSKKRYRVMTEEEIDTFFSHKFKHEYKNLIQHSFGFMMFGSGMRISDFLKLKWKNFYKINDIYYLKFVFQKSGQPHESRLSLEAIRFLRPFMESYNEESFKLYDKFKDDYDKLKKDVIDAQKEYDNIKPKSYNDLFFEDINVSNYYELNKKIKIESDKEILKRDRGIRLEAMRKAVPKMKEDMMDIIGSIILELKDDFGEDFVFPKMREVPKEDLHNRTHSMSGNFNHYLTTMQKELKIKTKLSNHHARHVFAQRLFVAGANFHFVSMALGHSSLQVTENYREQLVTDEAKDVSLLFSDTFKKEYY